MKPKRKDKILYPEYGFKFVFIDYTEKYYRTIAKKRIPLKNSGKFVQIRNNDTEFLVMAPKEMSSYHAGIAEHFLKEKGVSGAYNKKLDHYKISDNLWHIEGGGVWTLNEKEKALRLSGSSIAYGRFDRRGLREKIQGVKKLSGFSIDIE